VGPEPGPGVRPKRSKILEVHTNPPPNSTVVCVDELGPVTPWFFPPAPGWSPDGHRIKAPLEYSRGPHKAWVFGALRIKDGTSLTFTSRSRNSKGYLKLLEKIERAIPEGIIYLIADNLKTIRRAPWSGSGSKISQNRARFHPEGSSSAEPDRGVVATVQTAGAGWDGLRRQLRDRSGNEGRHPPAKPESEAVGLETRTRTAKVQQAHLCLP
jgi:hypothetical protein